MTDGTAAVRELGCHSGRFPAPFVCVRRCGTAGN